MAEDEAAEQRLLKQIEAEPHEKFQDSRGNLHPNLWCFCLKSLNPTILDIDDQQIAFSYNVNNLDLYFSAIYASTSNIRRKELWSKLNLLLTNFVAPWCFIGDFNTILGAHEHNGSFLPARPPMQDFQTWSDTFELIHIPTRGVAYTWDNGRDGRRHTKRRLDRSICNQQMIDLTSLISCSTLVRSKSDHYPLLLEIKNDVANFVSSFKFLKAWTLHTDCKEIITNTWKIPVVGCPIYILSSKVKALKEKLKIWNKEVFGNIHCFVKEAEDKLKAVQDLIHLHGHSDVLMQEEK